MGTPETRVQDTVPLAPSPLPCQKASSLQPDTPPAPVQTALKPTHSPTTGTQRGNAFYKGTTCTSSSVWTLGHGRTAIEKCVKNKQASKHTRQQTRNKSQPSALKGKIKEVSVKVPRGGGFWDSMAESMQFRQCTALCSQPQPSIHRRLLGQPQESPSTWYCLYLQAHPAPSTCTPDT